MVPDEVWEMMLPDLEIIALEAEREVQRKNVVRRAYREDYFYNRPTWDMEADRKEEEEYVEPIIDLYIPEYA
ncbi:hypothetical protein MFIFM68171_07693 [Madurella fahalii]|uniref:Uncharacterized protein n=1 Tax=Madurella fahalii TaxID=1157608 RepID=A0ABQ0GI86_9PEZI